MPRTVKWKQSAPLPTQRAIDEALDRQLEESFAASDPPKLTRGPVSHQITPAAKERTRDTPPDRVILRTMEKRAAGQLGGAPAKEIVR